MTRGKVLVASDMGAAADEALRQGDAWARSTDAELIVCHVLGDEAPYWSLLPLREAELRARAAGSESRAQLLVAERARQVTGRDDVQVVVRRGRAETEICAVADAAEPQLVVVGSRDLTGLSRLIAGSVAERVVRHASSPVLVARPPLGHGGALAATDFSDPAAPAVAAAVKAAGALGLDLTLMHALDVDPSPVMSLTVPLGGTFIPLSTEDRAAVRDAAATMLRAQLATVKAQGEILVEDGPAALAIIEAAERLSSRLVVLGTRGRTGLTRLALGSVAESVLAGVRCSVLVVRLRT